MKARTSPDALPIEPCDDGKLASSDPAAHRQAITDAQAEAWAKLAPHQQRVIAEAAARDDELSKLETFIGSPTFQQLDRDERILLTRQATIMEELVQCLHERIGLWMEVES